MRLIKRDMRHRQVAASRTDCACSRRLPSNPRARARAIANAADEAMQLLQNTTRKRENADGQRGTARMRVAGSTVRGRGGTVGAL